MAHDEDDIPPPRMGGSDERDISDVLAAIDRGDHDTPPGPAGTWEVIDCAPEALEGFLREGWEPYAVLSVNFEPRHWLRRRRR